MTALGATTAREATVAQAVGPERVGTTVGAAYGLVALASSAAAVVVPSIRVQFGLSPSVGSWIITSFVVALAASAPIYGRLADRIGTRTPVTIGLIVMAVGAVISASAPNGLLLLVGRVIQAAGAGAIPVLAPAIIAARTTDVERPRALIRMSTLAAAAAAGLLVGAAIAEAVGWRPVIAIPALGLGLLPSVRRIATTHDLAVKTPFDIAGGASVAAIAVGITLALQVHRSPPTGGLGMAIIAAGFVAAHVTWRNNDDPFLPKTVLRRRVTWRLALAAAAIPASYFALLIAIPAILTERHNASRLAIGGLLFPAALAGAAAGPLARRLRAHLSGTSLGAIGLVLWP